VEIQKELQVEEEEVSKKQPLYISKNKATLHKVAFFDFKKKKFLIFIKIKSIFIKNYFLFFQLYLIS
jgi:hypothetical protein